MYYHGQGGLECCNSWGRKESDTTEVIQQQQQHTIFIFLFLTSLCVIGSRFIHLIRTDSNVFLFMAVMFHCVYVCIYIYTPQPLYSLICQWTSRLLPCLSYCKQCYNEHWSTCVFFSYGFFRVYAPQWDCCHMVVLFLAS